MTQPRTPAEQYVVDKVQEGEIADLAEQFPEEEDRELGARFIEDLLTDSLDGVNVHRRGVRIENAVVTEPIDLTNAEVKHETWLNSCDFKEDVIFSGAHFHSSLEFQGSTLHRATDFARVETSGQFNASETRFTNVDEEANFNCMKVGQSAFFKKAIFAGPVNFVGSSIAGSFVADDIQFTNTEEGATFGRMKVGATAFFRRAVFAGPVNFGSADISGGLNADEAQFTNTEKEANFNGIKVGRDAFFEKAIFGGPVDFAGAEVSGQFSASEAQFTNTEKKANFNGIKIGQDAFFEKMTFAGTVDFVGADITGQFTADEAQFTHIEDEANFNGMKVGQSAFFRNATFAGPVSMADAHFLYLMIAGVGSGDESEKNVRLDLSRTVIRRELMIGSTKFESLTATSLHVESSASLDKVSVEKEVNFEHSRFIRLKFSDVSWPSDSEAVRLEGMRYEHIEADDGADSWKKLLEMAEGARYNVSVYSNLEEFFNQQGLGEQANKVFVARKRREHRRIPRRAIHRKFWSYFLDLSVRYGRSPARALGWGAAIIFVGYCVFYSQCDMVLQDSKKEFTTYSPFWYSLDLFVPFIDLKAASVWVPVPEDCFGWFWMRIQQILGWILIPTGLAAWMGIIK